MFTNLALRGALKSASIVLRESGIIPRLNATTPTLPMKNVACSSPLIARSANIGIGSFSIQSVRNYARAARKRKPEFQSQLSDLPPTMLKMDYAAVPLAQTFSSRAVRVFMVFCVDRTDDLVKRLLTLELASHSEKLLLKNEQLIAKVQRDETDRSSTEVKIALLTVKIRNYQEHLHKHTKDKANKRRMLMAIDCRKKLLKHLRMTRYDTFERVCQELDITYTFPPEYYRRITRRWLTKKALCIKVFKEVQKQKAEQRKKMTKTSNTQAGQPKITAATPQ